MKIIESLYELEEYFEVKIKTFYLNQNLIPFIGSGFTKGLKTRNKSVPDVVHTIKMMCDLICQYEPSIQSGELYSAQNDLQRIADYFYRFVPKNARANFLKDYFTNVQLTSDKKEIINLKWTHIYTLNIDDAIERNSQFTKIVPYHKLRKEFLLDRVFKLHGDAEHELTYDDDPNIIFSKQQYIKSLKENSSILSCFQEDFHYKNMIFIGCSLDNEIDLEFVIDKKEVFNKSNINIDKIYITTSKPNKLRQSDLESFGINVILVFNDYSDFYSLLIDKIGNLDIQNETNDISNYKNIKIKSDNNNLIFNKEFISGTTNPKLQNGIFELPYFLVERSLLNKILSTYKNDSISAIVGKRISGKTFLVSDIARRILNEDVYFFPSDISIDSKLLEEKISTIKYSTLIFDSNCLSYENLKQIADSQGILKNNHSYIIIVFNSSDRLLLPVINSIPCQIFELENKFNKQESADLNNKLSQLGLINFDYRETIIDNIFNYREQYYKEQNEQEISKIALSLTEVDIKILILSATLDKTYSNVYRMLNITHDDLSKSISKTGLSTSIEFEYELDKIEMHQHSGFKTIVNSKTFIFKLLGKYSTLGDVHSNRIADYVFEIVSRLREDARFESLQKNITLFDNLNQIFIRDEGGAIKIIFLIFKKLESLLFSDNHYWIQRAKSILYLKRSDISELEKALIYAKKPYYETYEFSRLQSQASLLVAMIYCRIAKLEDYNNAATVNNAIEWYYIALQENVTNSKFIGFIIEKAKKDKRSNDLFSLYTFLMTTTTSMNKDLEKKRNFIIDLIFKW